MEELAAVGPIENQAEVGPKGGATKPAPPAPRTGSNALPLVHLRFCCKRVHALPADEAQRKSPRFKNQSCLWRRTRALLEPLQACIVSRNGRIPVGVLDCFS